jgi:hypothetical protein
MVKIMDKTYKKFMFDVGGKSKRITPTFASIEGKAQMEGFL